MPLSRERPDGRLRRLSHKDPVTREVHDAVLQRDQRCVASHPFMGFPHFCRDEFGTMHPATQLCKMTLDHVQSDGRMGKRASSDMEHLVTLCFWAHITSGWAQANRDKLREYLSEV